MEDLKKLQVAVIAEVNMYWNCWYKTYFIITQFRVMIIHEVDTKTEDTPS